MPESDRKPAERTLREMIESLQGQISAARGNYSDARYLEYGLVEAIVRRTAEVARVADCDARAAELCAEDILRDAGLDDR